MLEKMLDKYYAKKLARELDDNVMFAFVKTKWKIEGKYFCYYIKRAKEEDKDYKLIIKLLLKGCFVYLVDHEKVLVKDLNNAIEELLREEQNDSNYREKRRISRI